MTIQFKIGRTYSARSACDHECIFSFTVLSRTEKMVTLEDKHGGTKARRVKLDDAGVEMIAPHGRYSMAPMIYADRESV